MLFTRALRKRWVLWVIFSGSLIYFLFATFTKSRHPVLDQYEVKRTLRQPFQWQPQVPEEGQRNHTRKLRCRNSVQGKSLIVDHRGFVCERASLHPSGCCDRHKPLTTRYQCETCQANGCCSVYEHCVSCCLHPDKKNLLQKILSQERGEGVNLFSLVTDQFELCLAKCRTSSLSVQHENSYRDPKAKFCYGENPPDLQSVAN